LRCEHRRGGASEHAEQQHAILLHRAPAGGSQYIAVCCASGREAWDCRDLARLGVGTRRS